MVVDCLGFHFGALVWSSLAWEGNLTREAVPGAPRARDMEACITSAHVSKESSIGASECLS